MKADRIVLAREMARRDIRANEMSALAGISNNTFYNIRNGKSVSEGTLGAVARVLGITLEQLAVWSTDDKPDEQLAALWHHAPESKKQAVRQVVRALLESESFGCENAAQVPARDDKIQSRRMKLCEKHMKDSKDKSCDGCPLRKLREPGKTCTEMTREKRKEVRAVLDAAGF